MVPHADFWAARKKILQSFLDRESIYQTPEFQGEYEKRARHNLRRSIERAP